MCYIMNFFKYLSKNKILLQRSINKKDFMVSFFSDVFVLLSFLGLYFVFLSPAQTLIIDFQNASLSQAQLSDDILVELTSVLYRILVLFISFAIIQTIFIISSRYFMWKRLSNSKLASEKINRKLLKYTKHYFSTLLLVLIFAIIPIILVALSASQIQELAREPERIYALSTVTLMLILMMIHTSGIFNYIFARSSKTFYSLGAAFNIGFLQIKYYILPYMIFGILVYLIDFIFNFFIWAIPFPISNILYFGAFIALATVLRLYLSRLVAILYKKVYSK